MTKEKLFLWIYGLVGITYLISVQINEDSHFVLKPLLLIPLLLLIYFKKNVPLRAIVFAALFFSWIGDLLLLNNRFFIIGLIAFLIAHLFYIFYFYQQLRVGKSPLSVKIWTGIIVVIYLFYLLYLLVPHAKGMEIPIIIYGIAISIMMYLAVLLGFRKKIFTFQIGAAFFVISDSILALNKFYQPINYAGFWIMSTYILAQGFLVYAILRSTNNNKAIRKQYV